MMRFSVVSHATDSACTGTSVAMLGCWMVLKQSALPGQFIP